MAHRVAQIIDAIAALVRTRVEPSGVHVFTHRRESLSAEQDELPADSVDAGELEKLEETEDAIYWALSFSVTAVVKEPTEPQAATAIFAAAREIHRAIMASPGPGMPWTVKLGLSFVITVSPMGWDEPPDYDVSGSACVGRLTTNWRAEFFTAVDDPGDG